METNTVLLPVLAVAIGVTLYRSSILFPLKYNRGWVVVCGIVAVLTGVLLVVNPDNAGNIGFATWTLLGIVPSLGTRLAQSLAQRGRYPAAIRVSTLVRLLHPADQMAGLPDIYRSQAAYRAGELSTAVALLEPYREQPPLAIYASTQIYRMQGDFAGLAAWLEQHVPPQAYKRDPTLAQNQLVVLGNQGKLNEMVAAFIEHRPVIERVPDLLMNNMLQFFTFSGRVKPVQEMLQAQLKHQPEAIKDLWLTITLLAAGQTDTGRQRLEALAASADKLISLRAQQVLRQPPVTASTVLTPEAQQQIDDIEQEYSRLQAYQVGYEARRTLPIITYALVIVNVLVYLLELQQGGDTDLMTLYRLGALYPPAVLELGEWWRVVAAMFLHLGLLHLLLNMLALVVLGRFTERMLGHGWHLVVYLVSGIGTSLSIIALTQLQLLPVSVMLGASGAIMGLIGATVAIYGDDWRRGVSRLARRRLLSALLIVVLQMGLDLLIPQTSFAGHLSGAVFGFLLTLLLVTVIRRTPVSARKPA